MNRDDPDRLAAAVLGVIGGASPGITADMLDDAALPATAELLRAWVAHSAQVSDCAVSYAKDVCWVRLVARWADPDLPYLAEHTNARLQLNVRQFFTHLEGPPRRTSRTYDLHVMAVTSVGPSLNHQTRMRRTMWRLTYAHAATVQLGACFREWEENMPRGVAARLGRWYTSGEIRRPQFEKMCRA